MHEIFFRWGNQRKDSSYKFIPHLDFEYIKSRRTNNRWKYSFVGGIKEKIVVISLFCILTLNIFKSRRTLW
jgi:hypothetical protein